MITESSAKNEADGVLLSGRHTGFRIYKSPALLELYFVDDGDGEAQNIKMYI